MAESIHDVEKRHKTIKALKWRYSKEIEHLYQVISNPEFLRNETQVRYHFYCSIRSQTTSLKLIKHRSLGNKLETNGITVLELKLRYCFGVTNSELGEGEIFERKDYG